MYRYVYLDENENFVKIDAGECMYVTIEFYSYITMIFMNLVILHLYLCCNADLIIELRIYRNIWENVA